ncbi:MAG: aminotransferase class V-fold PLP-dependent enzyme [bacterium]|nr:aminotransferase class V-fold PLP-dependent enzyme [bacterium]
MKKNKANRQDARSTEEIVRDYFDYSASAPDLETFGRGIRECIDAHLGSRNISSSLSLDELVDTFRTTIIPDTPMNAGDYIRYLKEYVVPHAINIGKPRYIGHMTSMLPAFYQYISQMLAVMNQNNVKIETSKVYTLIERQTLAMMHRLTFNLPASFYDDHAQKRGSNLGIVTSCGTLANITALWIARNKALQPSGEFLGLQSEGFTNALKHYGYHDAVIIGSAKMHYSMDKLGSLIGLGAENIIKLRLNETGSLDTGALSETITRCKEERRLVVAIVGIAGATETGQVDDLIFMAEAAREYGIHFHVDAAWSGPVLFSGKHKHILKGIELADSVTICGHKQLYLPQGISMVLCRDPRIIYHINATAGYQARSVSFDLGKHSPEGSRPPVCAYLHAGLHLLGREGYAYLIDEGMRKTAHLAQLIKNHHAFELIEEPRTNILVYRYIPEELRHKMKDRSFTREDQYVINSINEVLQDQQFLKGDTFISRTTLLYTRYGDNEPIVVLRAVISNPLTDENDLAAVLEDQVTTGDIVLKQQTMSFSEVLKLLFHQTSSIDRQ